MQGGRRPVKYTNNIHLYTNIEVDKVFGDPHRPAHAAEKRAASILMRRPGIRTSVIQHESSAAQSQTHHAAFPSHTYIHAESQSEEAEALRCLMQRLID
jgi:hypothetical protein